MPNRGLPRLNGGIGAREKAIWAGGCDYAKCPEGGGPVAGVVEFLDGPKGFCETCCATARRVGHTVRGRLEPPTRTRH